MLTVINHIRTIIQWWSHCKVCFNLVIVKNEIEKKKNRVSLYRQHCYAYHLLHALKSIHHCTCVFVSVEANCPMFECSFWIVCGTWGKYSHLLRARDAEIFNRLERYIYSGSVFRYYWTQVRAVKRPHNHGESYDLYILMLNKIQRFIMGFAHAESPIFFYLTHD